MFRTDAHCMCTFEQLRVVVTAVSISPSVGKYTYIMVRTHAVFGLSVAITIVGGGLPIERTLSQWGITRECDLQLDPARPLSASAILVLSTLRKTRNTFKDVSCGLAVD